MRSTMTNRDAGREPGWETRCRPCRGGLFPGAPPHGTPGEAPQAGRTSSESRRPSESRAVPAQGRQNRAAKPRGNAGEVMERPHDPRPAPPDDFLQRGGLQVLLDIDVGEAPAGEPLQKRQAVLLRPVELSPVPHTAHGENDRKPGARRAAGRPQPAQPRAGDLRAARRDPPGRGRFQGCEGPPRGSLQARTRQIFAAMPNPRSEVAPVDVDVRQVAPGERPGARGPGSFRARSKYSESPFATRGRSVTRRLPPPGGSCRGTPREPPPLSAGRTAPAIPCPCTRTGTCGRDNRRRRRRGPPPSRGRGTCSGEARTSRRRISAPCRWRASARWCPRRQAGARRRRKARRKQGAASHGRRQSRIFLLRVQAFPPARKTGRLQPQ